MMLSSDLPSDVKEVLLSQSFTATNRTISAFTSCTASVHLLCGTFQSKASVGKVIQIYNMSPAEACTKQRYLEGAVEITKKLPKHPSLVEVYHITGSGKKCLPSYHLPSSSESLQSQLFYFLVTEFCPGGSLQDLLMDKQLPVSVEDDFIRSLYGQIAYALLFLHSKQVAHRNLKCSKVLFGDAARTVVKLADSGITRSCWPFKPQQPLLRGHSFCPSAVYAAPEVLTQEMGGVIERPYNPYRASVYSLGVILYATAHSGQLPFQEWNLRMWIERQQASSYELHRERLSPGLVQLITELLEPDPEKRRDISQLLNTPWCHDVTSWKALFNE